MRRLDAGSLLQFAAAAVPVLERLTDQDQRMTYKEFGTVIGVVDQEWKPWHGRHIGRVLDAVAAASRLLGQPLLDHTRVFNQKTGAPGSGAARNMTARQPQTGSHQNPKPSEGEPIHTVYWLHMPDHTDPFSQGYVGITHRKCRQKEHSNSRRIPAGHIFTVLASGLSRFDAAKLEWEHRKQPGIGWNVKAGGGKFVRELMENEILLARTAGGNELIFHPHGDPHGRDI
jgi:hypothetical protein